MNLDDNITEVFDRYLTGQMTEVEEREFLEQLEKDPALKQNYEAHRALVAGIREARKEELKDYIKQNAKIRYIGNIWSQKWVVSSAAIVVILLSAYMVIEFALKPRQNDKKTAKTTEQVTNTEESNDAEVTEDASEAEDVTKKENNSKETDTENTTAPKKKSIPVIISSRQTSPNKVSSPTNTDENIDVYYEVATTTQYKYNGEKLTLYKFPYEDDVVIYKTGGEKDYLLWQRAYYTLQKDNKAHPLDRLVDGEILMQLPKLK